MSSPGIRLVDYASEAVQRGDAIDRATAIALGNLEGADARHLWQSADQLRARTRGELLHTCSIVNAKAGGCSEDCAFCSQAARYHTEAPRHQLLPLEQLLAAGAAAQQAGAQRFGMVIAERGLREDQVDPLVAATTAMKETTSLGVDGSLGLVSLQHLEELRQAGMECLNHNLESSERFFPQVCTTHTFEERVENIKRIHKAGMASCVGGILGMGESVEDRVDLALAVRALDVSRVPVNILNPIPGTPFGDRQVLDAPTVKTSIAVWRLLLPQATIFVAGGRERAFGHDQGQALTSGADGLMIGDYLTTRGTPGTAIRSVAEGLGRSWRPLHGPV